MEISGRTAVVTGGGSGMGRATALALAERGARVAVIDADPDLCHATAKEIDGLAVPVDVTDRQHVKAAVHRIMEVFSLATILTTCAGICPPHPFVSDRPEDNYQAMLRTIDVNLIGTINIATQFAQAIADAATPPGESLIIMVASGAAFDGVPGASAYCASKGGIVSLTHSLARELSSRAIRVNAISPGPIETPMLNALPPEVLTAMRATIPFPQRPGRPEEFASTVLHIIENGFLNGTVIRLDGGHRTAF
jgi:NAD(P)-dependent dehydrogenase (short-subunit alcohol dehydrogenase family)